MDVRPFEHVLELLRAVKGRNTGGVTPLQILIAWGFGDPVAALQISSQILQQVRLAQVALGKSPLASESQLGINQALNALLTTFSYPGIAQPTTQTIGNIDAHIAMLAMFVSFAAAVRQSGESPTEAIDLAKEVAQTIKLFDDPTIDPVVADIAKRHLQILTTLLQHIPIFGIEAALTTYFDLMMRIRRADIGSSRESSEKTKTIWDRMTSWGAHLSSIDKLVNAGAKLIGQADKLGLLDYHPPT